MVSPLHKDGTAKRGTSVRGGAVLQEARRKERTCPELNGQEDAHVWWSSDGTAQFLRAFAKHRAQGAPGVMRQRVQSAWLRRWGNLFRKSTLWWHPKARVVNGRSGWGVSSLHCEILLHPPRSWQQSNWTQMHLQNASLLTEFGRDAHLRAGGRFGFSANDFVRHLEVRAACGTTVINAASTALRFMEDAAAIPKHQRIGHDPWLLKQATGLTVALRSGQGLKREAPRAPVGLLVAMENAPMDTQVPVTLRCFAWWKLVCKWATLWFSDHRGVNSSEMKLRRDGCFVLILHRTKTTGKDKKVQERPLLVRKEAFFVQPDCLGKGLELWRSTAPWDRDFPLPTAG